MKRSEMIKVVAKAYRSIPRYFSSEEAADIILKEIEEAGMLPPYISAPSTSAADYHVLVFNGWKKEEEK